MSLLSELLVPLLPLVEALRLPLLLMPSDLPGPRDGAASMPVGFVDELLVPSLS